MFQQTVIDHFYLVLKEGGDLIKEAVTGNSLFLPTPASPCTSWSPHIKAHMSQRIVIDNCNLVLKEGGDLIREVILYFTPLHFLVTTSQGPYAPADCN